MHRLDHLAIAPAYLEEGPDYLAEGGVLHRLQQLGEDVVAGERRLLEPPEIGGGVFTVALPEGADPSDLLFPILPVRPHHLWHLGVLVRVPVEKAVEVIACDLASWPSKAATAVRMRIGGLWPPSISLDPCWNECPNMHPDGSYNSCG